MNNEYQQTTTSMADRDDVADGFAADESRFLEPDYLKREGIPPQGSWPLHVPRWNGEPLAGKTILLWPEQGYGDNIQFVRYASLVADLGATVIVGCHPKLQRLFRTVRGGLHAPCSLEELQELPGAYDYHAPILSLPYLFGTTVETIPAELITRVDFSKFWEHYLGDKLFDAFTEDGLRQAKHDLLRSGVPPMTVVAYFTHLGGMVGTLDGVVGRIERIQDELFEAVA